MSLFLIQEVQLVKRLVEFFIVKDFAFTIFESLLENIGREDFVAAESRFSEIISGTLVDIEID